MLTQLFTLGVLAQDENGWASETGRYQVSYESELQPVVINQMHRWTLHLTDASGKALSGAEIAVDGGMPAHNHGLATAPLVEEAGGGDYLLQGLRFHMMGNWELRLTITHEGVTDTAVITLDL